MKILVSACLLGENCKYSGGNNYNQAVCDFARGHRWCTSRRTIMRTTARILSQRADGH